MASGIPCLAVLAAFPSYSGTEGGTEWQWWRALTKTPIASSRGASSNKASTSRRLAQSERARPMYGRKNWPAPLQDEIRILLLGRLSRLNLLCAHERRREGRGGLLLVVESQLLELGRLHLEGSVVVGEASAAALSARPAAGNLVGLLLLRQLNERLHRQADSPLVVKGDHTHLHLLPLGEHVPYRFDAALLDLRDVEQAVDTLLEVDEGPK
eukprot:scaffold4357_cov113-Isochrysis_galbana.AAC.4